MFVWFWFDSLRPSQYLWSCRTVSSPNHTFFLGKLDHLKTVNQYFVHMLALVTDNNLSLISGREEYDRKKYFMINLHESMIPNRDQTRDPRICSQTRISSQTRYRLCYAVPQHLIVSSKYFNVNFIVSLWWRLE